MPSIGPLQAALIAFCYFLANSPFLAGLSFMGTYRPLVGGTIVGIILGDPVAGMEIGGAINLLYLGFISAGGALPADAGLAGYLGTALAMSARLPVAQAMGLGLALAVPLGLLGQQFFLLHMRADAVFARWADAAAARGSLRGVAFANLVPPNVVLLAINFVPVFLVAWSSALWWPPLLHWLAAVTLFGRPYDLVHALVAVGGALAAVGIAMNLRCLLDGSTSVILYLLGFGQMALLSMMLGDSFPLNTLLVIGLSWSIMRVASLFQHTGEYIRGPSATHDTGDTDDTNVETPPSDAEATPARRFKLLKRSDLVRSWLLWLFFSHSNFSFERLQATGFAHAMVPIIRRLYHTPGDVRAALLRHLVFFNSEPNWGGYINGLVIAMEEDRANGADISDEEINTVKTGLMGPLAGVGDTIDQGTLAPLALALGISLAGQGSLLGPAIYMVAMAALLWGAGWLVYYRGYTYGRAAITRFLQSRDHRDLAILRMTFGPILLGALTAQFVTLRTPLLSASSASPLAARFISLLLALAATLLCWYLLQRRHVPPLWLVAAVAVVVVLGAFFGIF